MKKTKIAFYVLSLIVISSGIFIRFWHLDTIPPGIHYDEAFNGLDAIADNESGSYKIFYTSNTGREGLHINVEAFFIRLFGVSSASLRLANALWGSLTLIGFWFLLRQLKFSKIGILVGISALAFSFWHLDFSRTAYRGIMVPLVLVWLFYFFLKGLEAGKRKDLYFIISGLLLGLGFHTYIAFRVTPLIFIILTVFLLILKRNFLKDYWKSAVVFFAATLLLALPILVYFYQHRNELMVRPETVSIFDNPSVPWTQALKKSFIAHMTAFFVHGDNNPRYNYNYQPILPLAWQFLFAGGFILSVWEIITNIYRRRIMKKNKQLENFKLTEKFYPSLLAQADFWVMLIPGVLSIEGIPHTLRIIGTIPGVFIFIALAAESAEKLFQKMFSNTRLRITVIAALLILVAGSGFYKTYIYFKVWAKDARTLGGYEKKLYDLGILVNELPLHKNNYLILTQNTAISRDSRDSSFKTVQYISYPKIKNYLFYHPIDKKNSIDCDDPFIILFESDDWLKNYYQGMCPGFKLHYETPQNGVYGFWVIDKQ